MNFTQKQIQKIMREADKKFRPVSAKADTIPAEYTAVAAEDDANFPEYLKGRVTK